MRRVSVFAIIYIVLCSLAQYGYSEEIDKLKAMLVLPEDKGAIHVEGTIIQYLYDKQHSSWIKAAETGKFIAEFSPYIIGPFWFQASPDIIAYDDESLGFKKESYLMTYNGKWGAILIYSSGDFGSEDRKTNQAFIYADMPPSRSVVDHILGKHGEFQKLTIFNDEKLLSILDKDYYDIHIENKNSNSCLVISSKSNSEKSTLLKESIEYDPHTLFINKHESIIFSPENPEIAKQTWEFIKPKRLKDIKSPFPSQIIYTNIMNGIPEEKTEIIFDKIDSISEIDINKCSPTFPKGFLVDDTRMGVSFHVGASPSAVTKDIPRQIESVAPSK